MARPLPRFLSSVGYYWHLPRRWLGLNPGCVKRGLFWSYPPLAAASFILFLYYHKSLSDQLVFCWISVTVTFVFSVQKQKADEIKLFADLFARFNQRYERLHKVMNEIRDTPGPGLNEVQNNTLYEYFNLCAEEFLFYKEGFINPEAWKAWKAGMQWFYESKVIAKMWSDELNSGSYYGLSVEELENDY